MECLIAFFVLLAIATLAIRAAAGGSAASQRRHSYIQAARQFSGRFVPGGLFGQPSVRFRYGDTLAALSEAGSRGPHSGRCTQLQINWPNTRFRVEIACHSYAEDRSAFDSPQVIKSGDAEFDRRFVVRGPDEAAIRQFLSDGVRWQIIRLSEVARDEYLVVAVQRGQLHVQKARPIRTFAALKFFVERSLELYDQAMITQAVGIEFIDNGEVASLEHVICKVCGEEIAGHEMVYCQRCKTPHHGDCWQYAGACSVYGCLEKNCRRPQSASTTNAPHTGGVRNVTRADGAPGQSS